MEARLVFSLLICTAIATSQTQQPADSNITAGLVEYVTTHYQTPEEYILSKFKDHDIIFLGEFHRIKHDPELVQRMIPLLHEAGVHFLGFEFARRKEQPLIDSLLQAPEYDQQLARTVMFKGFVVWGYQEYVDIFKAAWKLNRSLPEGGRPFRILALNNSPDWSLLKTNEDRDKHEVMSKVWHGETEADWAKVMVDLVIEKGEKALVYCGAHHAFTEYKQPVAIDGKFIRFGDSRVGNHIFQRIGKRAFTINLHDPWINADGYDKPLVHAADGYVDAVLNEVGEKYSRVGFDLRGTPFGDLPGESSIYKFGYDNFTLGTIYDGYICQGPLSTYQGVTPIADFINESNLEEARAQSPNTDLRKASADVFNAAIAKDADIPGRFSNLK